MSPAGPPAAPTERPALLAPTIPLALPARGTLAPTVPLTFPVRGALAADGTLYVADHGADAVFGYRGEQRVFELFDVEGPLGLAVAGSRLFVGSGARRSVEAFSTIDGAFLFAFGAGDGEIGMPNALAATPDGARVYVADSRADEILIYSADGVLLGGFDGAGSPAGALRFPAAIAVDATRVAVADQANHRVQLFDLDGTWQLSIGALPSRGAASLDDYSGKMVRPQGVALVGEQIAVLDAYFGTIQLFGADGAFRGALAGRGNCDGCVDLALDLVWDPAARAFLVMDPKRRRWVKLPLDGRVRP